MSKLIQIAHNAVNAKLIGADDSAKKIVNEALSYMVAGMEHMQSFKLGRWDGKSSFFSWKTASFPRGFVNRVNTALIKAGYHTQLVRKPFPEPLGPVRPVVDEFGESPRYDYQPKVVDLLLRHGQIIARVATGGGKCLGKDTPVLMFDGTIKMVQDVVVGDLLMGPDSSPRTVLSTCVGRSPLYRVTPVKGEPYVVNDAHILSLKKTSRGYRGKSRDGEKYPKGEIVNINVEDYLRQNSTFKHTHKGWRTGVDFVATAPLQVDPYLLGVILGDGSINGTVSVTTADAEILSMLKDQAAMWGLGCNVIPKAENAACSVYLTAGRTGGKANPLMIALRDLGFVSDGRVAARKFVPHVYKTALRADRLELLAGIIDTDGYFDGKCMYLTLKEEKLFDDVLFLVRSLGFAAYKSVRQKTCCNTGAVGTYFSMTISGDLSQIPVRLDRRKAPRRLQKKDHLVTGISVEAIGEGDYYGFELDGDHLFMLGDFTVTHNTRIAKLCTARINRPTLFLTTRSILMYQMAKAYKKSGRKVAILGDGALEVSNDVTCGMVQTIASWLEQTTPEAEVERQLKLIENREEKEIEALKKKLHEDNATPAESVEALRKLKQALEAKRPADEVIAKTAQKKSDRQQKRRAAMLRVLERFEFVILEEAHESSGNSFYEILRNCTNAHYRLALTATPFMKEDEEANMRLMASSGPIAIHISEQMLIERGILAKPYFKFIDVPKPPKLFKSTPWAKAYNIGIVENEFRNKAVVAEARRAARYGLSTMVLVTHKKHGNLLKDMLESYGLRAEYIFSEDSQEERQIALDKLARHEIDVLIGTSILDVGVDVPAVGMVILSGGGKAEVAMRQRIGRGLREKKDGSPNVCFVVDFADQHNNHLRDHAKQRQAIILDTPGFAENIVGDFDFIGLGFERKAA